MSALQRAIAELAQQFASQVVKAIGTASLQDIAALTGGAAPFRTPGRVIAAPVAAAPSRGGPAAAARRAGGRRRRTADDLAELGSRIVDLLKTSSNGMRAEAIRDALGVPRKELPRVFAQLVASGSVKKSGQKRATTYFVAEGGKSSAAPKSAAASKSAAAPKSAPAAKKSSKRGSKKSKK